jgi:CRISPR associated protein, Cas1 family
MRPLLGEAVIGALRRTVYRDFRVLEDAGFPLTSSLDGRRARWRMMPGYRHRLILALTWSELLGFMTARELISVLAGTPLHGRVVSALEKIRATLPHPPAERFRAAEQLVSGPPAGRDYHSRAAPVRTLIDAIEERRTIVARYRPRRAKRARRGVERQLDPYHLRVAQEGIALRLSRRFVRNKVANCRPLVRRNHPDAPESTLRELSELAEATVGASGMPEVLGTEGNAARLYFEAFPALLRPAGGGSDFAFDFTTPGARPVVGFPDCESWLHCRSDPDRARHSPSPRPSPASGGGGTREPALWRSSVSRPPAEGVRGSRHSGAPPYPVRQRRGYAGRPALWRSSVSRPEEVRGTPAL